MAHSVHLACIGDVESRADVTIVSTDYDITTETDIMWASACKKIKTNIHIL